MNRRVRRLPRLVVFVLLLLAVSPVTAPFSSCDLTDLVWGTRADDAALVHAKSNPDKAISGVCGSLDWEGDCALLPGVPRLVDRPPAGRAPHAPLRC